MPHTPKAGVAQTQTVTNQSVYLQPRHVRATPPPGQELQVLLGPVAVVSEETLKSTLQEGPNGPSPVQAGRVPVPAERGVRLAPAMGSPLSGRPLCAAPHRSRLDEGGGRT